MLLMTKFENYRQEMPNGTFAEKQNLNIIKLYLDKHLGICYNAMVGNIDVPEWRNWQTPRT